MLQAIGVIIVVVIALGAVGTGCGSGPKDTQSPVDAPDSFSRTGEVVAPTQWWRSFDDQNLDDLVERAFQGNFTLRQARAKLAQAAAVIRREGARWYPNIDGTVSGDVLSSRRRNARGASSDNSQSAFLGLAAGFEVDVWGRIEAGVDAARFDAESEYQDMHVVAISLSAEVAVTWYRLVEQYGQLAILDQQIKTNEQVLELVTFRFQQGQVGAADVLRQRQLLESTREDRIAAAATMKVLEHALLVLLGETPGGSAFDHASKLPTVPAVPDTGLPAELIRRRPDVRSTFFDLAAADRRAAAAIADQYPRISLSASANLNSEYIRDIFDNWLASLAANLVAPVFDAGRRAAEVDRAEAVIDQRLHEYGQVILDALREVEDALVQEDHQRRKIESIEKQRVLADDVVRRLRDQYNNGATPYLDVLSALASYQRLQRRHITAERQEVEFRIDLYRALAGPFEIPESVNQSVGQP